MGDIVKITELRCPSCGGLLKMPAGNAKFIQCEYCGNEYAVDLKPENPAPPRMPDWQPLVPEPARHSAPSATVWMWRIGIVAVFIVGMIFLFRLQSKSTSSEKAGTKADVRTASQLEHAVTYGGTSSNEEGEAFSGMLGEMVSVAFGKDADSVTEQELARIQWIADRSDLDNSYIGYSFENPLENPDAEIEWLAFPRGSERGYSELYRCTGLKRLETQESLSRCNLEGLHLESLSAPFYTLEEAASAFEDTSSIRQLAVGSQVESLEGLELFPNLELLSVNAYELSNVDALAALDGLKSLSLKNADGIKDLSVLASVGSLEELSVDAESLKSLEFLKRLSGLKSLSILDGKMLDLSGLETLEELEKLSVTGCSDLTDMSSVAALTGLKELTLEVPYDCQDPSLEGMTSLQSLKIKGFDSCEFLTKLTGLEELTLQYCGMPSNLDLSGLTQLKKLTFATGWEDSSLSFINGLTALEEVDLSGLVTYKDISGIFALPQLKKLDIDGIECEIAFDKVADNPSLEVLEMDGIKLYENVQIYGGGGIVNVYWDDVYLVDHLDFYEHFPNLKKLNVADNTIKELDFVGKLVKLEEIDFSDNYVTDMHILATLPSLKQVNCTGNPINNLRVLDDTQVNIINE